MKAATVTKIWTRETYAKWGIDYLKYDLCSFRDQMKTAPTPEAAHQMMVDAYMQNAQANSSRPAARLSIASASTVMDAVWQWGESVGANLWRTTGDISDRYARMETIGFSQAGLAKYAGPGHWNDPDMLEVGNGGMKPDEYKTHMSLWAILAAPLLAGNDLTTMTPETIAILTNQAKSSPLIRTPQANKVTAFGPKVPWKFGRARLSGGAKAVALFNRQSGPLSMDVSFTQVGFKGPVHVRDVWAAKDIGIMEGTYPVIVPGHGVVLLRLGK